MIKPVMKRKVIFFSLVMLLVFNIKGQESINPDKFITPENTSKVHTWWHWMNGNILYASDERCAKKSIPPWFFKKYDGELVEHNVDYCFFNNIYVC